MPLTAEQRKDVKERIARAETALKDATLDVQNAKRAGLDVTEEEKEVKRLRELTRGIKRVYG